MSVTGDSRDQRSAAFLLAPLVLLIAVLVILFPAVAHAETYEVTQDEYLTNWEENNKSLIQYYLDKAKTAQGVTTVVVKPGLYELKGALQIRSNTHLILEDGATLRRTNVDKGLVYNHGKTPEGKSWTTARGYGLAKNIVVEGRGVATIDGGDTSKCSNDGSSDLMRFDHAEGVTVKGLTFRNVYNAHHLEFVGVKKGLISNCSFSGFRRAAGHEKDRNYGREAIQLDSCWANGTSGVADPATMSNPDRWASGTFLDGTSCQDCVVEGCRFTNVPSAIGQHHWSPDSRYKNSSNIVIRNNVITGGRSDKMLRYAITVGGLDNTTVSGNTITGSFYRGVLSYQARNLVVSSNTIDGATVGVYTQSKALNAKIERNIIKNSGDASIKSSKGGSLASIANNTLSGARSYGVHIEGAQVSSIAGNVISSAKKYGILARGKVANISSNRITASSAGINVQSSASVSTVANNVVKGASYGILVRGHAKVGRAQCNSLAGCSYGIVASESAKISLAKKNVIEGAKKAGIATTGKSKLAKVDANTIKKAKKYGIRLSSKAVKAKVTNNSVQVHKKKYGISKAKKVKAKLAHNKIKKW